MEVVEMQVEVHEVTLTAGSTVGVGVGIDLETGTEVRFGGDWRMMRDIQEACFAANNIDSWDYGTLPVAEVPDWALL